jgi:hypothetical protein
LGLTELRIALVQDHLKVTIDDDSRYLSGSVSSSAAIVIGYLIQMEAFASLHVNHQSGCSSRMTSIRRTSPTNVARRQDADIDEDADLDGMRKSIRC